ncbi:MAG: PDGLE domain-containing protein [Candidatus Bathyarchaeia archaeon]|nr:PDGLE domain-containing protein [Candidatus Bathyarchaeia archaeon]
MNGHLPVIAAILVFLVVFIPLASSSPDGLERVVEKFGVAEQEPFWNGFMSDYAISAIADPYISTLLTGIFGTFIVLLAGFLLGKALSHKNPKPLE